MVGIKEKLYAHCQQYIDQRIATARQAIDAAQAGANEETKSSSGDKYETGRAMMQLEIEKNSVQLAEAMKLKRVLDQIKMEKNSVQIQPGSLVVTNQGNFFIAISVGQIVIEGETYLAISAGSPIGAKFMKLTVGATFAFAGKTYVIEEVW